MEKFDVVDERGTPTGETVLREAAHRSGILHRTAHVWIFRTRDGRTEVLLQKRSDNKDSYPGCYDISSAGHIPAGADFIPSALRELQEELGVAAKAADLTLCGTRRFTFDAEFHGMPFHDNQISRVYMLWLDREAADFTLQAEEVSAVKWFGFEDCIQLVQNNQIAHCIFMEELEMLRAALVQFAL